MRQRITAGLCYAIATKTRESVRLGRRDGQIFLKSSCQYLLRIYKCAALVADIQLMRSTDSGDVRSRNADMASSADTIAQGCNS